MVDTSMPRGNEQLLPATAQDAIDVAVFGGTGQTGAAVMRALRARGARAAALSRRDLQLGPESLHGALVAYLIAPNMHENEPELVGRYLELCRAAGVTRVVYHSVSAPFIPVMKHHLEKAMSEDLVRRSGFLWTILQPCAYAQNFTSEVGQGQIRVPFRTTAPFGLVDLEDVGEAAAVVCLDPSYAGGTFELGGPVLVSIEDMATAATEVTGRRIRAVAESVSEWASRNQDRFDATVLARFVDMWRYYDQHGLLSTSVTLEALLGGPARTVEDVLARESV